MDVVDAQLRQAGQVQWLAGAAEDIGHGEAEVHIAQVQLGVDRQEGRDRHRHIAPGIVVAVAQFARGDLHKGI